MLSAHHTRVEPQALVINSSRFVFTLACVDFGPGKRFSMLTESDSETPLTPVLDPACYNRALGLLDAHRHAHQACLSLYDAAKNWL